MYIYTYGARQFWCVFEKNETLVLKYVSWIVMSLLLSILFLYYCLLSLLLSLMLTKEKCYFKNLIINLMNTISVSDVQGISM